RNRHRAVAGCAVAELAEFVVAPAVDPTGSHERTGVPPAGGNRVDRARNTRNVDRGVAVPRRADPQLAPGVPAPALETATAGDGAGVLATHGDRADPAREARDVDWNA